MSIIAVYRDVPKPPVDYTEFDFSALPLDPRITFARSTTGKYWDGETAVKAEENLFVPSENASFSGSTTVTRQGNAGITPYGTNTATRFTPTIGSGWKSSGYKSVPATDQLEYVVSFHAKADGYNNVLLAEGGSAKFFASFNLSALSVFNTGGAGFLSAGVIDVGNGWRRCWLRFKQIGSGSPAIIPTPFPDGAATDGYGRANFEGDGTSGVLLWGFQVERRSFLTAYTPTTTAAVTRYQPVMQTAAINQPRIDHDPVTGEVRGLLVEEQRTNSLLNLGDIFYTAAPGIPASTETFVVETGVFAPDGSASARRFRLSASGHLNIRTISTGYAYVGVHPTCYVRSNLRYCRVIVSSTTLSSIVYDLQDEVVVSYGENVTGPLNHTPFIEKIGNGWVRIAMIIHSSGSGYYNMIEFSSTTAFRGANYQTPEDYFDVWGAQRESANYPTSYIPASNSNVTRAADFLAINDLNGIRLNPAAGAFVVEHNAPTGRPLLSSGANLILASQGPGKIAVAYDATGSVTFQNGANTGAGAALEFDTGLRIGASASAHANASIKRVRYYSRKPSPAELQELTA